MADISGVSSGIDLTALASAQQGQSATGATGTSADDAQNRFLTLLVTQLKNQDPLNPMDNAQLTTQLAQISTVDGIQKLNTTLQSLLSSYALTQSLQATGMIGQDVLVPGSTLTLAGGKAMGGVELAQPADKVVVTISDASGNVREQVDLGPKEAGVSAFEWDGDTPDGTAGDGAYTFTVTATRANAAVGATPLAYGRVTAVAPGSPGAQVTVGSLGSVSLSDVKQVVQQ